MPLTDNLGVFVTALTIFLSLTAVVFLCQPVQCVLLITPVVSLYFQDVPNCFAGYTQSLSKVTDFPSFLSLKMACFPINSSLIFMSLTRNAVFIG